MRNLKASTWLMFIVFTMTTLSGNSQTTNRALDFDGVNDWSSVPNSSSLNFNSAITLMLWVKTNDNRTAKIMEKETWNSGWTIDQDKWNGWQVGFTNYEGSRYSITWGNGIPTFGQWYHVAMVYDGDSLKLYIDGELNNSIFATSTIRTNSAVLSFAADNGSQKFFYGSIDEAQIWDIALTQSQINSIKGDYITELTIPAELDWENLKGYWSFDEETTEDSIFDSSTYQNDGIINNMDSETDRIESTIFDAESSPLPVNLLNFSAEKTNDYIQINWQTSSEINNQYFVLEKSIDGREYIAIELIPGNGNSNVVINYNSTDYSPSKTNYYRLKQVDFDGTTTLSKTIIIETSNEENILEINKIFFQESKLLVEFTNSLNQKIEIEILDLNGKSLIRKELYVQGKSVDLIINTIGAKSIYIVKISNSNQIISKKFIN